MMNRYLYLKAFSMVEMVAVLAIMSIVTLIAIPNYQQLVKKFQYMEIIHEVIPWRIQVEMCYWHKGDFETCSMGHGGIGHFRSARAIAQLEIEQGYMYVVPQKRRGLKATDTVTFKPLVVDDRIEWSHEGPAVDQGYL